MIKDFNKWLYISNLQKSIRLGNFDVAKDTINLFWENDSKYLIYRLGTILLEDISIANIDLSLSYLKTNLKYDTIEKLGGKDYILNIVNLACKSAKDRTSCDASYCANFFNKESIKNHQNFNELNEILSLWEIIGFKKFKNINYINRNNDEKDNLEQLNVYLNKFNIPENLKELITYGYKSSSENIFLGILNSYTYNEFYKKEKNIFYNQIFEKNQNYNLIYDNVNKLNLIDSALDFHTNVSYKLFDYLKNKIEFINILKKYKLENIDLEMQKQLIKHVLFRTEGHNVDKRVYYPYAIKTMRMAESIVLEKKFNLNSENSNNLFDEMYKFLNNEKNNILNIRKSHFNKNQLKNN